MTHRYCFSCHMRPLCKKEPSLASLGVTTPPLGHSDPFRTPFRRHRKTVRITPGTLSELNRNGVRNELERCPIKIGIASDLRRNTQANGGLRSRRTQNCGELLPKNTRRKTGSICSPRWKPLDSHLTRHGRTTLRLYSKRSAERNTNAIFQRGMAAPFP